MWGLSTRPGAALAPVFAEAVNPPRRDPGAATRLPEEHDARSAARRFADACLAHTSYGVAYSPGTQRRTEQGKFTAALELIEERQLSVAFLYHMALQRNIHNPFEKSGTFGVWCGWGGVGVCLIDAEWGASE